MKFQTLSRSFCGFKASVRTLGFGDNGSHRDRKQSDMRNRIKILRRIEAMHPQTLLPRLLEAGIVTLGFGAERINFLERNAFAVDGKPVVIGKCDVFGAAAALLAVVPILVIARAAQKRRLEN